MLRQDCAIKCDPFPNLCSISLDRDPPKIHTTWVVTNNFLIVPEQVVEDMVYALCTVFLATSALSCEIREKIDSAKCLGKNSGLGLTTSLYRIGSAIRRKSKKLEHASDRCSLYSHVIVANEGV